MIDREVSNLRYERHGIKLIISFILGIMIIGGIVYIFLY